MDRGRLTVFNLIIRKRGHEQSKNQRNNTAGTFYH